MRKFLPYIVWLTYALFLFAMCYSVIYAYENELDDITKIGLQLYALISVIFPIFLRPIQEHLIRNIFLYTLLSILFNVILSSTIMPKGILEEYSQQMLRGGCLVISSILPVIILHFVNQKLRGD